MKYLIGILICSIALSLNGQHDIDIMTYNIRLDHSGDGQDNWHKRKTELAAYCKTANADFLGLQEVMNVQYEFLKQELAPSYGVIGVGRDDGKTNGEYAPIFYNSSRWKLVSDSTFWLSQTPSIPSKGWDANYFRICTFGIFVDKQNNDTVLVSNVHFDHVAVLARANSVELLKLHHQNYKKRYPCILMGDFNLEPTDTLYKGLSNFVTDAQQTAKSKTEISKGTFNSFDLGGPFDRRIDYVWYDPAKFIAKSYLCEEPKTSNGRQLSDHFPVRVNFIQTNIFKEKNFTHEGHSLPYRIINNDKNLKSPLLLFMHGRGESGNDNWKQLLHGSENLINAAVDFGAVVIAPQCGMDDYWATVVRTQEGSSTKFDFQNKPKANPGLNAVIALLDSLVATGKIDKDRIYVSGLSMGGMATWELLWRKPNTFAAAAPICGGGLPEKAALIGGVPIWTFHGTKDNVVNIYHSLRMLEAIQRAGGKAKISIYEGVGHNSWDNALADPEYLKWMFSKRKNK